MKLALVRARRSARRLHRLDQDRRRTEEAPGRVAGHPARSRAPTRARLEAVPRRVRPFFTRRNADLAQRKEVWSANQAQEGSALRPRRGAGRIARLGARRRPRSAGCRPTGRPSDRFAAPSPRRSGSASGPPRIAFFDRYKRRDDIELESRQADREALAQELESFLAGRGRRRRPDRRTCSSASARCARAGTSRCPLSAMAPIR